MDLLGDDELERSAVVANCRMNRERDLPGSNGYDRELGFDPLDFLKGRVAPGRAAAWLDLCCGIGQGPDRGGRVRPLRGAGRRDRRRRSGRDVPPARPRPDLPAARRGVPDPGGPIGRST